MSGTKTVWGLNIYLRITQHLIPSIKTYTIQYDNVQTICNVIFSNLKKPLRRGNKGETEMV